MRTTPPVLAGVLVAALALVGCNRGGDDVAIVETDAADAAAAAAEAAAEPDPVAPPAALTVAGTGDDLYLADASGRALYVLEGDDGKRCLGDCLAAWQPLSGATPIAGAEAVQAPMISSISHDDGSMHVTYNGLPLYYFARDTGPGMTRGQDVEDAWGHWYLVRPTGELVPASLTKTAAAD